MQIVNPIAELVIRIGMPIKDVKPKTERQPGNVEAKIRKCLV